MFEYIFFYRILRIFQNIPLLKKHYNIKLVHVKAHTNNIDIHSINNNKADYLAKKGSKK